MNRGRLLVFLGAAPGVGKTLLHARGGPPPARAGQGRRRRPSSSTTAAPRRPRSTARHRDGAARDRQHGGIPLEEVDLAGVLARRPQVALVDELAHTNAPGSEHAKRWEDVDTLLDAGIDVLSTVNIQHIASLNDVVERITGHPAARDDPGPGAPARGPHRARRPRAAGAARPPLRRPGLPGDPDRRGAVNYFRVGNLTALRELALLWLADEVDSALQRYRTEHGIDTAWEARERVVVALTGGPGGRDAAAPRRPHRGEVRRRRAARGPRHERGRPRRAATRARSRRSACSSSSSAARYHQVVGDDIPTALIGFARAVHATQLVIGVSRRSRLLALLTGPGTSSRVIRASGDIDVHMVTHSAAGQRVDPAPARPRRAVGAAAARSGSPLALVGGPLLTLLLDRDPHQRQPHGGGARLPAARRPRRAGRRCVAGRVRRGALRAHARLPVRRAASSPSRSRGPRTSSRCCSTSSTALLVSFVVDRAARLTRIARRSASESEVLATIAGGVLRGDDAVEALLERTREAFRMGAVRLLVRGEVVERTATPAATGDDHASRSTTRTALELVGRQLDASDRRILDVVATQLGVALEQRALTDTARRLEPLAEVDRVRSALLAAVGHDLRRPLAVATAAVTSLRSSADRALPGGPRAAARERGAEPRHARASSPTCSM